MDDTPVILWIVALVIAAMFSLSFIVLKLLGVLLLSWWWLAIPVPGVIVLGVLGIVLAIIIGK